MKKLILMALLAALSLTVVACGGNETDPADTESETTVETSEVAESDADTGADADTEGETDTESVVESAAESETEAESEAESETEAVTETEAEKETETQGPAWQSGENVALGKYVQASGSAWDGDMWGIPMVVDGSIMQTEFEDGGTNGWMSNAVGDVTGQTWIIIDLGREYPINKITLYPRQSGERFPTGFYLEVSTDGSVWTKVAEETADPYTLEGRTFEFDTVNAAYVRLTTTEMHADSYVEAFGGYIAQISEIEVFAE